MAHLLPHFQRCIRPIPVGRALVEGLVSRSAGTQPVKNKIVIVPAPHNGGFQNKQIFLSKGKDLLTPSFLLLPECVNLPVHALDAGDFFIAQAAQFFHTTFRRTL